MTHIEPGHAITVSTAFADPGQYGTLKTYEWDAYGGSEYFDTGYGSTFTFTPTQEANYTVDFSCTDEDGLFISGHSMTIPYGQDLTPWQPDSPTLTITECDANGTPTTAPVIGGTPAYFLVSASGSTPNHADVTVSYHTIDGGARGGIDYSPTCYGITLYYNGSGYTPRTISIPTIASPDQKVGDFTLSAWEFDGTQQIPTAQTITVQCTVQQSWWSASDSWTMRDSGAYTAHVVAHGNPTVTDLAKLITGSANDWVDLMKTNRLKFVPDTDGIANGTVIDVAPLLQDLEDSLRDAVVSAVGNLKYSTFATHGQSHLAAGTPLGSTAVDNYFTGTPSAETLPLDCKAAALLIYEKALLDVIGTGDYDSLFAHQRVPFRPVSGSAEEHNVQRGRASLSSIYTWTGKPGDWAYIDNVTEYLGTPGVDPDYIGENVICTDAGKFAYVGWASAIFWGFPIGKKDYNGWAAALIGQYNLAVPWYKKIWPENGEVLESNGGGISKVNTEHVRFINVASVAIQLFNYRNKPRPFATP